MVQFGVVRDGQRISVIFPMLSLTLGTSPQSFTLCERLLALQTESLKTDIAVNFADQVADIANQNCFIVV